MTECSVTQRRAIVGVGMGVIVYSWVKGYTILSSEKKRCVVWCFQNYNPMVRSLEYVSWISRRVNLSLNLSNPICPMLAELPIYANSCLEVHLQDQVGKPIALWPNAVDAMVQGDLNMLQLYDTLGHILKRQVEFSLFECGLTVPHKTISTNAILRNPGQAECSTHVTVIKWLFIMKNTRK